MKTLLVPAFIALFALPAVAGEVPKVTLAPASSTAGSATTAGDVAASVATGDVGSTSQKAQQSVPSFSGYGGGCDRGHASTEAMLIN